VHTLAAQHPPLPSPLPEEPPVPFAYVMRLSSTLAEQELDPRQQTHLLAELKSGLDEDGDDPTARGDIARLLRMLRDRHDVTYRTRTEIDALLASIDSKSSSPQPPSARPPPQHEHPVARVTPPVATRLAPGAATTQPRPPSTTGGETTAPPRPRASPQQSSAQPPSARPRVSTGPGVPPPEGGASTARRSAKRWLIAGGAGLAVIVAIVLISVFATQRPGPTPSTTPSTEPPSDLDSILLGPADVSNIMGVVSMQSTERSQAMRTPQGTLSSPDCLGAFDPIEAPAYQNSGYSGVRGQALHTADGNDPHRVYQAAVDFPSAERAQAS
jgi:hypothetical protein